MRHKTKRRLALLLTLSMSAAVVFSGCADGTEETDSAKEYSVRPGETVSPDSKWINSAIEGSVDETVQVRLQDDFYTAVNADWDRSFDLASDEDLYDSLMKENEDMIRQRKLDILSAEDTNWDASIWDADSSVELTGDMVRHSEELVEHFAELAGDWEARNANGVEPLRPYIEQIWSIASLEDMTALLVDKKSIFSNQLPLVSVKVENTWKDPNNYHIVIADDLPCLTLDTPDAYANLTNSKKADESMRLQEERTTYMLQRLGYEQELIEQLIRDCYAFECKLADKLFDPQLQFTEKYLNCYDNSFTLEELEKQQGAYPLTAIIENQGLEQAEEYTVYNTDYLKQIARIYSQKNLEQMKAYYIVHFIARNIDLLDREAYDKNMELLVENEFIEEKKAESDIDILFDQYINKYLAEPMDIVYIARYSSPESKQGIIELINEIKDVYKQMLQANEERDASFVEKALTKLDHLAVRAVYPDIFTDYSDLEFSDADDYTLVDAVAAITAHGMDRDKERVDQPVDKKEWNLATMPTTTVNAYYMPLENSINIFAGILASGFVYDPEAADEVNMARLGAVIGHEISHAFDTNGILYDENGMQEQDMDMNAAADVVAKSTKDMLEVSNYYSNIMPYPGATYYMGVDISNEALADIGGVKCMLLLAEQKDDFDYDLFYRSYAQLWREKTTYMYAYAQAESDDHPMNFMRANVVLQQFDQFLEFYDIKPGDGMYLSPEKKLRYW